MLQGESAVRPTGVHVSLARSLTVGVSRCAGRMVRPLRDVFILFLFFFFFLCEKYKWWTWGGGSGGTRVGWGTRRFRRK
jgi:predicted PurR-regulated permease PerM